ncbi:MAG: hypothetical protein AAB478_00130 [Patescibacteria group bacterium]
MKQAIKIIVIGAITIVVGLILLGIAVGEDPRDGVPVQDGANAAAPTSTPTINAGDLKACDDGSYVLPGKDCPKAEGPTATPTVNTGNLKPCDNDIYVLQNVNCPGAGSAQPTAVPAKETEPTKESAQQACLGSAKFDLSAPDTLTLANPGFMVVDFYTQGQPQSVTVLPFPTANMVYDLKGSVLGAYWIYPASCDMDVLVNQAIAHADQLKGEGYNITGYISWEDSGVFTKK